MPRLAAKATCSGARFDDNDHRAKSRLSNHRKLSPAYKNSGVDWLGEVPEYWGVKRLKFVASISQTKVVESPADVP